MRLGNRAPQTAVPYYSCSLGIFIAQECQLQKMTVLSQTQVGVPGKGWGVGASFYIPFFDRKLYPFHRKLNPVSYTCGATFAKLFTLAGENPLYN